MLINLSAARFWQNKEHCLQSPNAPCFFQKKNTLSVFIHWGCRALSRIILSRSIRREIIRRGTNDGKRQNKALPSALMKIRFMEWSSHPCVLVIYLPIAKNCSTGALYFACAGSKWAERIRRPLLGAFSCPRLILAPIFQLAILFLAR